MTIPQKITYIHEKNSMEDKSVNYFIDSFLSQKGVNSANTEATYRTAVSEFFQIMADKSLDEIRATDLEYSVMDIEQYQRELAKSRKNSTVNTKLTAVKQCFEKLYSYGFKNIDLSSFNVSRLREYDTRSHDHISLEELKTAIEIVKGTQKGDIKALMLEVAFVTGFRKQSMMDLKWEDISWEESINKHVIKTLGKGQKWDYKKISLDVYERLSETRPQNSTREDRIFSLSDKTIQRMFNLINEEMDFGDRKISFHSLKKGSIEEVGILTGYDLQSMQRQGNHANIATTLNIYAKSRDLKDMVMIDLTEEEDYSDIEKLNKRELIKLIKTLDRKTKNDILEKAKEIIKNENREN